MKTYYARPELEVVLFCGDVCCGDIIVTSDTDDGEVDVDGGSGNSKDFG